MIIQERGRYGGAKGTIMEKEQGTLLVLSGFSGAGKGTVIKKLFERYADNYALSVSATTRQPRPGEVDGQDYFFKTREEFEKMIANNELIEYARYVDNYYGTPRAYVEEKLAQGVDVILEIEIQGALQVRKQFENALLIFITPPSAGELRRRLEGRGTETAEVVRERLRAASEEASSVEKYDYVLLNDRVDACAQRLHMVAQTAKERVSNRTFLIGSIREELLL